ncbi:hypothetical protein [Microbacterium luticocti]|uniref:hypothetical protein n=1 Tax=Microbacterium luticocti TaxID=451764 RepID=UPI000416CA73|nr:hypothetical protein [Microbacterium luticocti]
MSRRAFVSAAVIVLGLLTGCSAHPAPSPTPSPRFTSEADAYKAAEDTYRTYVDALNAIDTAEPATFEDVFRLESGNALDDDKKTLSGFHADGVKIEGDAHVTVMEPASITLSPLTVRLSACFDVSDVRAFDADGNSLVDPERDDVQSVTVTIEESQASPTGLAIRGVKSRDGDPEC